MMSCYEGIIGAVEVAKSGCEIVHLRGELGQCALRLGGVHRKRTLDTLIEVREL